VGVYFAENFQASWSFSLQIFGGEDGEEDSLLFYFFINLGFCHQFTNSYPKC